MQINRTDKYDSIKVSDVLKLPTLSVDGVPIPNKGPIPEKGDIAYDTSTETIYYADGISWKPVGGGGAGPTGPTGPTGPSSGILPNASLVFLATEGPLIPNNVETTVIGYNSANQYGGSNYILNPAAGTIQPLTDGIYEVIANCVWEPVDEGVMILRVYTMFQADAVLYPGGSSKEVPISLNSPVTQKVVFQFPYLVSSNFLIYMTVQQTSPGSLRLFPTNAFPDAVYGCGFSIKKLSNL